MTAPTLGMSYTWWEGAGTGWATDLSTAIDYGWSVIMILISLLILVLDSKDPF